MDLRIFAAAPAHGAGLPSNGVWIVVAMFLGLIALGRWLLLTKVLDTRRRRTLAAAAITVTAGTILALLFHPNHPAAHGAHPSPAPSRSASARGRPH